MRNKVTGMTLAVLALGLLGCSDKLTDDAISDKLQGDESYVYMNIAVSLPSGTTTRSTTDDGGQNGEDQDTNSDENPDYEYGYAYENDVRSMLLVLADAENDNYITHSVVSGITQWPNNDPLNERFNFTVSQKFSREEINNAYENANLLKNNQKVNVYAFCNYTADLFDQFEAYAKAGTHGNDWLDWNGEVVEGGSAPGTSPIIQNSIWSSRSFLMSNSRIRYVNFPSTPDGWNDYTTEEKPFDLSQEGPVYVERTAARIDYKDGSEYTDGSYRYDLKVKTGQSGTKDEINLISVQLTRMGLVNMSKKYYYLRRVSANGEGDAIKDNAKNDAVTVGGAELQTQPYNTNFVIDTDWADKGKHYGINTYNAGDHFNFPLFETSKTEDDAKNDSLKKQYNFSNWYADNIKDVLGEDKLNDTWNLDEDNPKGSYKIWRYVTENTIPAPVENQKTVQSIGVVFRAAIIPGTDINDKMTFANGVEYPYISDSVKEALDKAAAHTPLKGSDEDKDGNGYDYPILYFYNSILYAGVKDLVASAVAEGVSGQVYGVLNEIFGNWVLNGKTFEYKENVTENDTKLTVEIWDEIYGRGLLYDDIETDYRTGYTVDLDESSDEFKKLVIGKKITIYEVSNENMGEEGSGWGYYCYYFYWNRHNSNNNNSIMAPMEFATVRNNVYKLSVTKIGELGHPNIPENDPDPVDPEDPDEEDKVYMQVQVEVLPWVVRVNDIEF
ncbi:MAG: Mfa1 fimbrilin C-terminal domain-containing protein [Prevotella sp.]|nr:Mfa1 fimbrilin C-terminal domain-containing protein [Prevotella sp.]